MRPNRSSGGERGGFTLIEIMVVVFLIGIITAMIVPEMKGAYQGAVLRSASRELVNACQLTYSRAVSFNQPHRLRVIPESHRYVIEKRARIDQQEIYVPLRDVPGGEGDLDSRVKIQLLHPGETLTDSGRAEAPADSSVGPGLVINFYPDGTADAAELVLQDRDGFRLAVRLNPTTARVRVLELGRETTAGGTEEGTP